MPQIVSTAAGQKKRSRQLSGTATMMANMSDVLKEICDKKRGHVASQKELFSESVLIADAKRQDAPRGFYKALAAKAATKKTALITEVKKASPSKGIIRADFN